MKKFITLLLATFNLVLLSQPDGKWATKGNAIDPGDFIGTTNNASVDFRVNNVQQMSLGTNGALKLNSLSGVGNRILLADANGNLVALPTSLSTAATSWDSNGNNIFYNGGNLGIGTSSPSYKLDVNGDARISNNLYVGGGIIVTDKLDAAVHVKAGDVIVNNDLSVAGNSKLSGVLTASQGIMFDNTLGMRYTSGTTNGTGSLQFGKIQPIAVPCAAQPNNGFNVGIGGTLQIFDPNNSAGSGLLNFQTWPIGCSIDASVGGNTGNQGLLLNYWCGNNTFINTGANGGIVYTGNKVDMAGNLKVGYSGNSNFDPNTSIELYNGGNPTWNGIKFITPWNNSKVLSISNTNFANSPFTVYGNGKTEIGIKTQKSPSLYVNAMLTIYGGPLVSEEIIVTQQNWADYVFNKDYCLPTWKETETYFRTNKHLKDVPTAKEIIESGNNIGETSVVFLKKIEEAYLYISGLHSDIAELRKEIQELKKTNEVLLNKTK